jgi:hypothetical protein
MASEPKEQFNIDDPRNVNFFLELIGRPQKVSSPQPRRIEETDASPASKPSELKTASNDLSVSFPSRLINATVHSESKQVQDPTEPTSRPHSIPASPAHGIKAPPSTPATGAVTSGPVAVSLEPIEEDGSDILRTIANASNLNLNDSKYAPKNYKGGRFTNPGAKYSTMPARRAPKMSFSNSFAALDEDATGDSLSKGSDDDNVVTKYQDEVIEKFVKEKTPEGEYNHLSLLLLHC